MVEFGIYIWDHTYPRMRPFVYCFEKNEIYMKKVLKLYYFTKFQTFH